MYVGVVHWIFCINSILHNTLIFQWKIVHSLYILLCFVQEIMLFIQNLPTTKWGDKEVEILLAEAYKLKFMFADAPGHLTTRRT